jgi:hypothetical protein
MATLKKDEHAISLEISIDFLEKAMVMTDAVHYTIPIVTLVDLLTQLRDKKDIVGKPRLVTFDPRNNRIIFFPIADKDYEIRIFGTVRIMQ